MDIFRYLSRTFIYAIKDLIISETIGASSSHINRKITKVLKNEDDNVCPSCGEKKLNKIENETEVEKISNCPSCGAVLEANAKFCGNCGSQICK